MRTARLLRPHSRFAAPFALLLVLALASCSDMGTSPPGVARLTPGVTGLSFGVKEAGDPRVVRSVTITNEGSATSASLEVAIEGTGAAVFAVDEEASSCIDLELAPGASCSVVVSFGGAAAGPQSASLFIDGGPGIPRVAVTMNGILQALLNVFAQGNGGGGVRVEPDGPACDAVCSLTFIEPAVTLSPVPDAASRFVEWVGTPGCGTTERCTIPLVDLNAVTLRFELR